MLGKRGFLLEGQLNNVCREAGARVSTNVFVRDMDLTRPRWWQTASLCGRARRKAATHNGAALQCARRRKTTTYPELTGEGGRARLVVLAAEVGGRFSKKRSNSILCARLGKGEVSRSATDVARPRQSSPLPALGRHPRVQGGKVFRSVVVGPSVSVQHRNGSSVHEVLRDDRSA